MTNEKDEKQMSQMFDDLTATAEDMIRAALTVTKVVSPAEIEVRKKMANQVLSAWATGAAAAQPTFTSDFSRNFDAEHDRLEELINELSLAIPAAA
ncbi:hypothetical protein NX783_20835 [Massilia kyonggiensis]|nr:hypothetical protein [Massilia kyonggiensis]